MKQRKASFEDRFERKARAMERKVFREKRSSEFYKYDVDIEGDDDFDTSETGVMPNNSNLKRK